VVEIIISNSVKNVTAGDLRTKVLFVVAFVYSKVIGALSE
jgi:hypothetical protein